MIVGLTGRAGVGKTSVGAIFKNFGVEVIDVDQMAHTVYARGTKAYEKVIKTFGKKILEEDGVVDRKKLGEIVFSKKSDLRKLEKIVHPEVKKLVTGQIKQLKKNKVSFIMLEGTMLDKISLSSTIDFNILLVANKKQCFDRLTKNGFSEEMAEKITAIQDDMKFSKIKYIIENSNTFEETLEQIKLIWAKIQHDSQ